tara:strand:- start:168 stop:452 length:285 start_codon:yes stop_codon:yes gene_type:complete
MKMSTQNELTLTDDAISSIAKLLQVAILTGTDIVDNLRTLQLVQEGDKLTVSPNFVESFENNVQNMLSELEDQQEPVQSNGSNIAKSPFDVSEG